MSSVFISYRRNDSEPWAVLINDRLCSTFGKKNIFFDLESLSVGKWKSQISESLDLCDVLIIIIGREWLSERLFEPDDVHRYEIRSAINKGLTIIPIVTPDAKLPLKTDLPDDISLLLTYEAFSLSKKETGRRSQLREIEESISKLCGIVIRHKKKKLLYQISYIIFFLLFFSFSVYLPTYLEASSINKYRERWELNYQASYEKLDRRIFKNINDDISAVISQNNGLDNGVLILALMKKKVSDDESAKYLIPQYVDFFEEWLTFCEKTNCKESPVYSFFKDKILEVWANYRCWINELRSNGYSSIYGKKIENYYESDGETIFARQISNASRDSKVTNSLELCRDSKFIINF